MTNDIDAIESKTSLDSWAFDQIAVDTRMAVFSLCAEVRELRAENKRLAELAYLGEHHFPDMTYKARLEELALDHAVALAKQADCLVRAERAEAALERARALAERWERAAEWNTAGYRMFTIEALEMCGRELAAALAPDGAKSAPQTEPTCDLCKIQAGIQAAMDIIEPLPEIGDHYDAMVTRAFDALDDAYGYHKHEHSAPDGAR